MPNEYIYQPCEGVNPETMKPNGNWHFCCVTTDKRGQPLIYPIGYCRSRKCTHKTPQEAADCFRLNEIENDTHTFTGEDFVNSKGEIIKGREVFNQCRVCGVYCKTYCQVGIELHEFYLCEKHMNEKELKKLVPEYKVNYITKQQ